MKKILIIALLLLTTLTGCRNESANPVPQQERYQRLEMENAAINHNITLVSMKTSIRQGESGSMTVRGKPGKVYTIAATFKRNGSTYVTTRSATAGNDGLVTWTWDVAAGTQPGSYPITVKCGDDKLTTMYTVE